MPSSREIKRRIRSVKNIMQITMALEAVSASKVRRATQQVLATRAYADSAMEVLLNIGSANRSSTPLHPLLAKRENVGNIVIVLITSDRGLAGPYNTNIIRVARQFAREYGKPVRWIAVGRKGRDMLIRARENVIAEFTNLPPWLKLNDVRAISRVAIDDYLGGTSDEVYLAYTDFINTLTQRPRVQRFLPLLPDELEDLGVSENYMKLRAAPTTQVPDYIFEPSASAILDEIVPKFSELIVFQAILEAVASEQSARMVAMRNASDAGRDISNALQLTYNKVRQASITSEILDIVGGVEALSKSKKSTTEAAQPQASVEEA